MTAIRDIPERLQVFLGKLVYGIMDERDKRRSSLTDGQCYTAAREIFNEFFGYDIECPHNPPIGLCKLCGILTMTAVKRVR